jgi:hypothetical protein
MLKLKLLVGLGALLCALVVIAAPANAAFQSNGQTDQGKIKSFPAKIVLHTGGKEGASIECKSSGTPKPEGEWHVQVKQTQGEGYQEQAKKGPAMQLKITKWGECTGPEGFAIEVECNLILTTGQLGTSVGPYPPGCKFLIGPKSGNFCRISFSTEGNKERGDTKVEKVGTNEVSMEESLTNMTAKLEEVGGVCVTFHEGIGSTLKSEGGKYLFEGVKIV